MGKKEVEKELKKIELKFMRDLVKQMERQLYGISEIDKLRFLLHLLGIRSAENKMASLALVSLSKQLSSNSIY